MARTQHTRHRAHVSTARRFFQGASIGAALVVGALVITLGALVLGVMVPNKPDQAACTTDLVQVGLENMTNGKPAAAQPRPASCNGLSEVKYATARHEAAVQITAIVSGR
jgi:hypothetical protein